MSNLHHYWNDAEQSIWLDNIRRDWLDDGTLATYVADGVRGVTSNPAIFAKALTASDVYNDAIAALATNDAEEAFEILAVADVQRACDVLRSVYDSSSEEFARGERPYRDGYVSLEVSPRLAHDTDGTIAAAIRLWKSVDRPNLMIKIPATVAGLPAISAVLAEGINVNVTLIFSLERYQQVLMAYTEGISAALSQGRVVGDIASVASFFVSRVDAAIDSKLSEQHPLFGKSAIAQVAAAYQLFIEWTKETDVTQLLAQGAQVQRPLWASTSTKNPHFPALLYVDSIAISSTVNTVPDATLDIAREKGDPRHSVLVPERIADVARALDELPAAGINLSDITDTLERDGVSAFVTSYEELLATVASHLK